MGNIDGLVLTTNPYSEVVLVSHTHTRLFSSGSKTTNRKINAQNKVGISYPDINTLNISFL